jgi:Protein of unknown function (DUF1579)
MKTKHTLIFGSLLFLSCSLFAQDAVKKDVARPEPTKEEKAWMDYMTPGPMQQMLAKSNGDWSEELTFWMTPGAEPTKAVAKCFNSMILGDRYQVSTSTGDMMGMPFEGRSTVAYDNVKKLFQSTWIDNMGTGIVFMEGPYDAATKTVTLKGKMVDPMSGKIENARQTMKFVDDNNQIMEMYVTKDGKEFKNMVIKFTRR